MQMNWNWVLVVAGAVMVLVEVALGGFAGFDLVLIGSSFVLGGALGLAVGNPVAGLGDGERPVPALHRRGPPLGARAGCKRPGIAHQHGRADRAARAGDAGHLRAPARPGAACATRCGARVPPPARPGALEAGNEVMVEGVDGVTLLVRRS